MPFTQAELDSLASATLDFHMARGQVFAQSIQDKPLLKRLMAKKKTFPGGKESITVRVKGEYTTTIQGYAHDDQVGYANPAHIKQAAYPWREIHAGIKVTMTELKKDGITVLDSATGASTRGTSGREMTALANLLVDKLEDMSEGTARGLNLMFWQDGTQDAKQVPGIKSFVVDDPAAALVVAGIDQGANPWWRNRSLVGANAIAATSANAGEQVLVRRLSTEIRQLRRFGGKPDTALCGADFLDQLEAELRAKGQYTQTGWAGTGTIDVGVADAELKGVRFEYDPTLDDFGEGRRAYLLDARVIFPMIMDGEDMKQHAPSRPEDRYVIYRAVTWTGGLVCRQRNANGVYEIA
jgi:hypothetical protein